MDEYEVIEVAELEDGTVIAALDIDAQPGADTIVAFGADGSFVALYDEGQDGDVDYAYVRDAEGNAIEVSLEEAPGAVPQPSVQDLVGGSTAPADATVGGVGPVRNV